MSLLADRHVSQGSQDYCPTERTAPIAVSACRCLQIVTYRRGVAGPREALCLQSLFARFHSCQVYHRVVQGAFCQQRLFTRFHFRHVPQGLAGLYRELSVCKFFFFFSPDFILSTYYRGVQTLRSTSSAKIVHQVLFSPRITAFLGFVVVCLFCF